LKRGILLVNLGTPDSTAVSDVRRYLGEFLMDRHVVDVPWLLRKLIVSGFILPTRPKQSAHAYRQIWDAAGPGTGSPLLHYSRQLTEALAAELESPVELAMRYGSPSIDDAVNALHAAGVDQLLLIALYPQYAASTVGTTIEAVTAAAGDRLKVDVLAPFYDHPAYVDAQAELIARHLPADYDHLLLSYHGLPERHLTQADPTGSHCLKHDDCCQTASEAHATCYRHQVFATSSLLAERLGINPDRYSVTFQSRLGRLPWLTPYTDLTLAELPERGVRRLAVACPAFVADNLETLEEIGISGQQTFLDAGGEAFTLIPCLNSDPAWVRTLASLCQQSSTRATQASSAVNA
jgi:ferrochelatase